MPTPPAIQPPPEEVLPRFAPGATAIVARPHGHGHINAGYAVAWTRAGRPGRGFLQRLNPAVFPAADQVMENIARVGAHLARRAADSRVPRLISTAAGAPAWIAPDGARWRLFEFIAGARAYDRADTPARAAAAARAFARFARALDDLPPPRLHRVLPGFHDTPARRRALEQAIAADPAGRAAAAAAEIAFARARADLAGALARADLPERIAHNDTKLNNVLFDAATDAVVCVVDLDTVMPGSWLHDYGDMVRSMTLAGAEDEPRADRVGFDRPCFEALSAAWLEIMGPYLTAPERALLLTAGLVITLETGLRFLTDHLNGDVYFRIARPGHNLDRCRTQFALVAALERQAPDLEAWLRRQ